MELLGQVEVELEVDQAAGLIWLAPSEEPSQFLKVQVVASVAFAQEAVAQAACIWACFSLGEGKWCSTKTIRFYFEPSLYPQCDFLQMKAVLEPAKWEERTNYLSKCVTVNQYKQLHKIWYFGS